MGHSGAGPTHAPPLQYFSRPRSEMGGVPKGVPTPTDGGLVPAGEFRPLLPALGANVWGPGLNATGGGEESATGGVEPGGGPLFPSVIRGTNIDAEPFTPARSSHRRRGYRRGYEHRRRRVLLRHRLRHRLLLHRLVLRRLWDAAAGHGAHRARGVAVGWVPRRRALLVHLRRGGVIRRRRRWMRLLRRLWDAAVRRLVGRARGGMGRRPGLRGGIPRRVMCGRDVGGAPAGAAAPAPARGRDAANGLPRCCWPPTLGLPPGDESGFWFHMIAARPSPPIAPSDQSLKGPLDRERRRGMIARVSSRRSPAVCRADATRRGFCCRLRYGLGGETRAGSRRRSTLRQRL